MRVLEIIKRTLGPLVFWCFLFGGIAVALLWASNAYAGVIESEEFPDAIRCYADDDGADLIMYLSMSPTAGGSFVYVNPWVDTYRANFNSGGTNTSETNVDCTGTTLDDLRTASEAYDFGGAGGGTTTSGTTTEINFSTASQEAFNGFMVFFMSMFSVLYIFRRRS